MRYDDETGVVNYDEAEGDALSIALGEAGFVHSRGAWVMSVPVARYHDGEWRDGGTVYTAFDYDGMVDEARRWALRSIDAEQVLADT